MAVGSDKRVAWSWVMPAGLLVLATGCGDSIHDYVAKADIVAASKLLDRDPALLEARNPLGKTPLFLAVTSGSDAMVQTLLDRGAAVNAQDNTGLTPLHVAAWWTATARARQLLDAGADPDAKDHFGDTPLHVAAMRGREAMTVFLVQHGAHLDATNDAGLTPLSLARKHGQEKTVVLLKKLQSQERESAR